MNIAWFVFDFFVLLMIAGLVASIVMILFPFNVESDEATWVRENSLWEHWPETTPERKNDDGRPDSETP